MSYVDKWAIAIEQSVTSVILRENTVGISDTAFGTANLESITIPASVLVIGEEALACCEKLVTVTFAEGSNLKSIGDGAFERCTSLASVEIPASVTSISLYAFSYCSSLTSIKYCGTESQWNAISKGAYWNNGTSSYTITYNYTGE